MSRLMAMTLEGTVKAGAFGEMAMTGTRQG